MGWLGRSLGDFGSQLGEAKDIRQRWQDQYVDMLMKKAQMQQQQFQMAQQQQTLPLQLQELQQRVKQMGQPIPEGTTGLPGGGLAGLTYDPSKGQYGSQQLIAPSLTPQNVAGQINAGREKLSPNDQAVADSLLGELQMGADPSKVMDKWQQFFQGAAKAQKQKPPMVDVNKGTVTVYDAFGNGQELPIYDASGKPNTQLPPDLRALVASQITGFDKHQQQVNDAALTREQGNWAHQDSELDKKMKQQQDMFDQKQSASDQKQLNAEADRTVAAAAAAYNKWLATSMSAGKANQFAITKPGTWFGNGTLSGEADIAQQEAENTRLAAVDALTAAGRPIPPQLRNPIGGAPAASGGGKGGSDDYSDLGGSKN